MNKSHVIRKKKKKISDTVHMDSGDASPKGD